MTIVALPTPKGDADMAKDLRALADRVELGEVVNVACVSIERGGAAGQYFTKDVTPEIIGLTFACAQSLAMVLNTR